MHAIRLHAFGSADQLVLDEIPTPAPSPAHADLEGRRALGKVVLTSAGG